MIHRGESRSIEFDGWLVAHPADVFDEHFDASFLVDGVVERMVQFKRAAVHPIVKLQEARDDQGSADRQYLLRWPGGDPSARQGRPEPATPLRRVAGRPKDRRP
ncbi:MAG: hypothetical protein NTZ17_05580 [Phycisphaerae bacterium]|nr:hypothetical protein [Phycisphaerae bacterium]